MKRGGRMGHVAHGQTARRGGQQRGGRSMAGGAGSRARVGHHLMMLAQLDANQDKQLSKDEMIALFDKIDANADGNITLEEGKTFHETQRAEMTAKMKEAFSPDNIFKKLDKNADGKLSQEDEIKFWDRLSQSDADKDGSVSKEEFDAGVKKLHDAMKERRSNRRGGPQKDDSKKEEPKAEEPKAEEPKAESAAIELPVPMPEDAAVEAEIPVDTSDQTNVE